MLYITYLIIILSLKEYFAQNSNLPSIDTKSFVTCTLFNNCSNIIGGLQIPTPQFILPKLSKNFTEMNTSVNYYIQSPYDLPLNTRFALINNTYNCFVYSNDSQWFTGSGNAFPRCEYRSYYNFINGTVAFEGFFKIPCTSSGFIFFQIFGLQHPIFMMRINNNALVDYPYTKNICTNWHFLNVTLDINSQTNKTAILSYLDNQVISNTTSLLPGPFVFKFGAYIGLSFNSTQKVESFYQNIRISKKGNISYTLYK